MQRLTKTGKQYRFFVYNRSECFLLGISGNEKFRGD